jgi:hypothetical protein
MGRFPGAHIGFRTWALEAGVLRAAGGEAWVNGEPTEAKCSVMGSHPPGEPVPTAKHSCGLHLFHRPPADLYLASGVLGVAIAWGKVVRQSDGFRAQFGLPVALCKLPTMQVGVYEAAQLYCTEWEIPWFETVADLVEEGLRYADPVPEELWTSGPVTYEAPPPPTIRATKGSALPRIEAARVPFQKAKRLHQQRVAARERLKRGRL